MPENKVVFGLENVHYATFTIAADGTITYDDPVPFPGATEIALKPKGDQQDFYADNTLYYTTTSNQGYDATLTVASVTEAFRTSVLGEILEATDKVLTEKNTVNPKNIALLFEFSGDVKATRHILYNCTVSRPELGSTTKEDSTKPGTSQLNLVAAPRTKDGVVKRSTTADTTQAVYDAWYSAVYEPVGA